MNDDSTDLDDISDSSLEFLRHGYTLNIEYKLSFISESRSKFERHFYCFIRTLQMRETVK